MQFHDDYDDIKLNKKKIIDQSTCTTQIDCCATQIDCSPTWFALIRTDAQSDWANQLAYTPF
jgi:hypothetical protein